MTEYAEVIDGDLELHGDLILTDVIDNRTDEPIVQARSVVQARRAVFVQKGTSITVTGHMVAMIGGNRATITGVYAGAREAAVGPGSMTIDVNRKSEVDAEATILSAPIAFTSSDDDAEMKAGTLAVTNLNRGDMLTVDVVAVAGGGSKPERPILIVMYDEESEV